MCFTDGTVLMLLQTGIQMYEIQSVPQQLNELY